MTALATVAAIGLFGLLVAPIVKPLAWSLIIGTATFPYYERLARKLPDHPDRAAALMVLAMTFCFILPAAALIVMMVENAAEWYLEGEQLVLALTTSGSGAFSQYLFVRELLALGESYGVDLSGVGAKIAAAASGYFLDLATNAALNLGELFFILAVALFVLFFIYRDGERIMAATISRFATNPDKIHRYLSEIRSTTTAVTVGTVFTCIVQGATAGIGYYAAGVPHALFWAALTALAALLPVVGTGIVWVPVLVYVVFNGALFKAILLGIWCIFFVGLADNAIRPLVIGTQKSIPVPAIVLGAICGVIVLGILGLIVGPVLFAVLITVWRDVTIEDQV